VLRRFRLVECDEAKRRLMLAKETALFIREAKEINVGLKNSAIFITIH
jgi:hypothetical protein